MDLLRLIENTLAQKRIYANPSSYPNPKAQLCFRTDEIMKVSFIRLWRYRFNYSIKWNETVSNTV